MTKQKENLNKLIEFIGMLLEQEGNEWLVDELLKVIETKMPLEQIAKHSVIVNIHEYCIEEKIKKQASEFYDDFRIEAIKPQLIKDYEKIEHERRRDDFENFCLCMYQQIENITNYLFDKRISTIWNDERSKIVVKFLYSKEESKNIEARENGTLEKLIFQRDKEWSATSKYRAVLFFYYFNQRSLYSDYDFNAKSYEFYELYQMRNKNHRGGTDSNIHKKVLGSKSRYYFTFYGFLADFVFRVNSNIHEKAVDDYTNVKTEKSKKSTLIDNPEFDKLKDLFKK